MLLINFLNQWWLGVDYRSTVHSRTGFTHYYWLFRLELTHSIDVMFGGVGRISRSIGLNNWKILDECHRTVWERLGMHIEDRRYMIGKSMGRNLRFGTKSWFTIFYGRKWVGVGEI